MGWLIVIGRRGAADGSAKPFVDLLRSAGRVSLAAPRRHEVLDRAHAHSEGADRGRGVGIDDVIGVRGNQRAVTGAEQDAGIRRRRGDRHLHGLARMQTDPVEAHRASDALLGVHDHGLSRQARCQWSLVLTSICLYE